MVVRSCPAECPGAGQDRQVSRNKEKGMFCKSIRFALLAGGILALTAMPVRADDAEKEAPKAATSDCTQYCTVCVKEWVPETYQTTRTVYHKECVQIPCTITKWETVQEQRTRQVVCTRMVPETKTITKTICGTRPLRRDQNGLQDQRSLCERNHDGQEVRRQGPLGMQGSSLRSQPS